MLFFKIIFWLIVIYYAVKLLARFFLPFLLKKLAKKVFSNFGNMQNQTYQETYKKQGEVTIEYNNSTKGKSNKNKGDYVDYEEIK